MLLFSVSPLLVPVILLCANLGRIPWASCVIPVPLASLALGEGRRLDHFLQNLLPLPLDISAFSILSAWLSSCPTGENPSLPVFPAPGSLLHACISCWQSIRVCTLGCENTGHSHPRHGAGSWRAVEDEILNSECFGKLLCYQRDRCSSACRICALGCTAGRQLLLPQGAFSSSGISPPAWALAEKTRGFRRGFSLEQRKLPSRLCFLFSPYSFTYTFPPYHGKVVVAFQRISLIIAIDFWELDYNTICLKRSLLSFHYFFVLLQQWSFI